MLDALAASLEETVDAAAAARPDPGRPALHRLNRAEYANAIRDLLGLDVDVTALLPPDTAAFGFDNASDAQGSFAATTNFNESGTAEGSLAIVKFLVERGARLDIRNKQGRTALESVLRGKEHSTEIVAFLRDRSPAPAASTP